MYAYHYAGVEAKDCMIEPVSFATSKAKRYTVTIAWRGKVSLGTKLQ